MITEETYNLIELLGKYVTLDVDSNGSIQDFYTCTIRGMNRPGITKCLLVGTTVFSKTYTGKIIAIITNESESEHYVVVAPSHVELYAPWLKKNFEPTFGSNLRYFCAYEKSCGIIPYRIKNKHIEYLTLFQKGSSTWSFPKGHMEYGENEIDTAKREVKEEIGIDINIQTDFRCEITYNVHNNRAKKTVVLFAVPFEGEIHIKEDEIGHFRWLNRYAVQKLFGHKELYKIFNRLEKKIQGESK